jgi:hypothetical protein
VVKRVADDPFDRKNEKRILANMNHTIFGTKLISRFVSALPVLALGALSVGCGGSAAEDVAESQEAIYNGTTVTQTGTGHLLVNTKGASYCSGVLLANNWVLTASHCDLTINPSDPSYTTQVVMDYATGVQQVRSVIQIVINPNGWDVALVKVNSPFDINGSPGFPNYFGYAKRMYPWNDLLNQTVTGWGYGANAVSGGAPIGAHVLRNGTMKVIESGFTFDAPPYSNIPGIAMAPNPNQMIFDGDSGGATTVNTLQGPNTLAAMNMGGVIGPNGAPTTGYAVPTASFSQWAIKTMYPNRALMCHGVECLTTQAALANNSGLETSWAPCGGYRASWEAQLSLENNADFFYINNRAMTGNGTFTGVEPPGAMFLKLRTNGSVQSPGVNWLRIRCIQ